LSLETLKKYKEKFMKLEELRVYQLSMDLGENVWGVVEKWNYFSMDTVGKQLVRAADSIAANLSEGYGRFHYKESRQFCYYARGSLSETKTWLKKAYNRKLIDQSTFELFLEDIESISIKLNKYINSIGKQK
jgi:four helix bundle protein